MENNQDNNNSYCPSYTVKPGAKLYGIVNENGFINYLKSPIEINQDFIEEAYKGREPDSADLQSVPTNKKTLNT